MRKQLLGAALGAGVLCTPVYAAAGSWTFAYQGFVNYYTGEFEADQRLDGAFEAEDLNHDNVITFDELSTFTLDGNTYTNQASSDCGVWKGYCHLSEFSYTATGQLSFSANYEKHFPDPGVDENGFYVAGSFFVRSISTPGASWTDAYDWSDQTVFTITPPPVPEPNAALLLPAGMAIVALAARRRGRAR